MAENDSTPTPETAVTVVVDDATPEDLNDAGKKALAEERRAKREAEKQLKELTNRLKEYEDRDKTEAQKLLERAETAEREREALMADALRSRVALAKGLPPALADRLRGNSEQELLADADALLALVPPDAPTRPRGDVDQGVRSAIPLNGDPLLRDLKAKLGIA